MFNVFGSLRLFISMFPSTPLLTDKEEEKERDDKEVEIVLCPLSS